MQGAQNRSVDGLHEGLCGLLPISWVGLDLGWSEEEGKLLRRNISRTLVGALLLACQELLARQQAYSWFCDQPYSREDIPGRATPGVGPGCYLYFVWVLSFLGHLFEREGGAGLGLRSGKALSPAAWPQSWGSDWLSFLAEKEPQTFPRAGRELEMLWSQAVWEPTQVLFLTV